MSAEGRRRAPCPLPRRQRRQLHAAGGVRLDHYGGYSPALLGQRRSAVGLTRCALIGGLRSGESALLRDRSHSAPIGRERLAERNRSVGAGAEEVDARRGVMGPTVSDKEAV
jgi:hypothetical protein